MALEIDLSDKIVLTTGVSSGIGVAVAARQKIVNSVPMKRMGTPEDTGAWCVFLSSEYAAFAAGQTFLPDGGRSAVMLDE